ncbi:KIC1 [Candida oxycetoniae]|uniref:non-specific serine/threonine protein kinase n=1 Tax=Candida oxycetoniae TaxID=497107 RepID=A0AAI9SYT4_9ASCO|nr:KIC1 [Candida oxycetoniae]KAI3405713.2 KIC1 [Candida oxycetoniae]
MSSISQYKRTEVIGRGKFGVVYKAYHKQTKEVYAIKVLNLDSEEEDIVDVQQEIQFLTELKNVPNITHYHGSILQDTKLWIIMDYCAGGSLRTLLKAGVIEEKYIAVITRELLLTLSAVHKMGVIHRDLKAANVLISKEGNVQLCDFGVAAKISSNAQKRTTMAGTPYWMAPEVIKSGETYDSKADIWSLGITIYEIATGNPPYCDKDASWAMQLISKATPPRLEGREYSPALKECIALCLDENPEERPTADSLFRCKLIKAYKGYSTNILKEVITRYLIWRERNSSRDSVFLNLENEKEDSIDEIVSSKLSGFNVNGFNDGNDQIQVKWDFDSLESKEYIMENDIDLSKIDYNNETQNEENTYPTLTTLKTETSTVGRNNSTKTLSRQGNTTTAKSTADIPRSLQMLFEDPDENRINHTILTAPSMFNNSDNGTESPTIEIPDMEALSSFPSSSTLINHHSVLNKPPALLHTQSASGMLECRYTQSNTSPIENRPRKKTNSSTMSISTSSALSPSPNGAAPHTPPYTTHNSIRTPSPKPPTSLSLSNLTGGVSKSGSPSKMKVLQNNSNPLLQPINFKSGGGEGPNKPTLSLSSSSHPPTQAPPTLIQQHSMPVLPQQNSHSLPPPTSSSSSSSSGQAALNFKTRRNKPGFIQMPTPSTSLNTLAALTDDHRDDENVNQFGINPAQAAQMSVSMTPVTEKEPLQFPIKNDGQAERSTSLKESTSASAPPITAGRPHQNSISAQKKSQPSPSNLNTSLPNPPLHTNTSLLSSKVTGLTQQSTTNGVSTAPSTTSTSISSSNTTATAPAATSTTAATTSTNTAAATAATAAAITAAAAASTTTSFPLVPTFKGDLFVDSTTNKSKLIYELDTIIKLFNQGLDALEENL